METPENPPVPPAVNPYAPPTADVNRAAPLAPDGARLAGRWPRLGAVLIDGLLLFVALIPAMISGYGTIRAAAASGQTVSSLWWLNAGALSIVSVLAWLAVEVFQAYLICTTGQTIGKRLLALKIVRIDGGDVKFLDGVLLRRWLLMAASWIPRVGMVFWLVDVLFIFRGDRRCLHDLLAKTRVIELSRR